jgi:RHS repeat-associated protein
LTHPTVSSAANATNESGGYTYDPMNRKASRIDPLSASETYGYDGNGNLTGHTDRRGKVEVYQYDGIDRRKFAGFGYTGSGYESTSSYTFDLGDRITQIVDSIAGTTMRQYDLLDDLTDEQTAQGEVGYQYDNARRRQAMTVVGQPTVSYSWDNADRLTGITQGSTSIPIAYDNADRRTTLTLPNGIILAYTHDADSHVTGMTWTLAGNPVGDLEYGYDADGRVIQKTGSLAQTNLPQPVTGNTFNAANEMTSFNGTALTYDANGNLTNDGTNTYTWDARNHLVAIAGGNTASFAYDADGRRALKAINGTSTQLLYDGANPVQELQNGAPSANLLTGLGIDEYFQRTDTTGTYDYLSDILGSTVALTSASGSVQTQYMYDPFGNSSASGTASSNSFQFTGRENDGTGMDYYRARYYSPDFQRFIGQDLLDFGSGDPNLYAYTSNQPTSLRDPLGTQEEEAICAMDPDLCIKIGQIISDLLTGLGAGILMSQRGNSDPYPFPPTVNPGKDANGNCLPCPSPPPPWSQPGSAHGSSSGSHWHAYVYNQDENCECRPKRVSASTCAGLPKGGSANKP